MLGTIINELQSLLLKRILLSGVAPVSAFLILNGTLLYAQDARFRGWASSSLLVAEAEGALLSTGAMLLFLLLLVSFFYSILNTRLREVMEGEHWPAPLKAPFVRQQRARFDQTESRRIDAHAQRRALEDGSGKWMKALLHARRLQTKRVACKYGPASPAALALAKLHRERASGRLIRAEEFERTAGLLAAELAASKIEPPVAGTEAACKLLDDHQDAFRWLVLYALTRVREVVIDLHNQRHFFFPEYVLAPTAMGNIARSVSSYTRSRYGFNIDLLWLRLQKVMQEEAFYGVVQDAKTQLDFTVSAFWLSLVSLVGWAFYNFLAGFSLVYFLATWVGGVALTVLIYGLCLQSYRAFADLLRSSVDLFRLKLLADLRIPQPTSSEQERQIWAVVDHQLSYGERVALPITDPPAA